MNSEHQLVPVSRGGDLAVEPVSTVAATAQDDPMLVIRRVHNMMRGRYLLAIIAAILLGAGGAAAGWFSRTPVYKSTGIIRIEPILPKLIYENEQNRMLPMFDSFVESQVMFIQSRRIIERAMQHEAWKSLKRGTSFEVIDDFIEALSVSHPGRSEFIVVSFLDEDRVAAMKAVKSIIDAYSTVYGIRDTERITSQLDQLEQRKNSLRNELASIEDRKLAIAREFGTDNLGTIFEMRVRDLYMEEGKLKDAELQLQLMKKPSSILKPDDAPADGEPAPDAADAAAAPRPQVVDFTVEQIVPLDVKMKSLVDRRDSIENSARFYAEKFGKNHPTMKDLETERRLVEDQIEDRRIEWNQIVAANPDQAVAPGEEGLTVAQMEERVELLRYTYEKKYADVVSMGEKNMQIKRLVADADKKAAYLSETERRLEQLTVEAVSGGRITVVSDGDQPLRPHQDDRLRFAVLGGGAGAMLGFGMLVVIALLDQRLRSIHDAQDSFNHVTMLGILPRLPDDLADPDQAAMAAHCVHQIRTLLQIGSNTQGRRVFCVTSPASQDGKTSLTLALGLSFAASGAKTLLIDCDLAGGGLSARVNAIIRRKIGQILQRQSLVTEQQIEQALRVAQESDRRLGETLVDLGFVQREDLNAALHIQEQMRVGLLDVVAGEPLEACMADTGIPGLSVLPIGGAEAADVAKLSPGAIRRMLDEARSQFDMVVVDTGPIPGALEASQVAAESDGVVMIVSRGEQRGQAEKSIEHLASIGARVTGLVFNRAEGWDMRAVSQSMSVSMSSQGGDAGERQSGRYAYRVNPTQESSRFGPVARAVASSGSRKDEGNGSNGSES